MYAKPNAIVSAPHSILHTTAGEEQRIPTSTYSTPFPKKRSRALTHVCIKKAG
jgi:hypothetical protein